MCFAHLRGCDSDFTQCEIQARAQSPERIFVENADLKCCPIIEVFPTLYYLSFLFKKLIESKTNFSFFSLLCTIHVKTNPCAYEYKLNIAKGEDTTLKLVNFKNNAIKEIANLNKLTNLIFLDLYNNQVRS